MRFYCGICNQFAGCKYREVINGTIYKYHIDLNSRTIPQNGLIPDDDNDDDDDDDDDNNNNKFL